MLESAQGCRIHWRTWQHLHFDTFGREAHVKRQKMTRQKEKMRRGCERTVQVSRTNRTVSLGHSASEMEWERAKVTEMGFRWTEIE